MNSSKQPTINIGVLGHVSFGKSTFTRQATGTNTVIHSKEKKRGYMLAQEILDNPL